MHCIKGEASAGVAALRSVPFVGALVLAACLVGCGSAPKGSRPSESAAVPAVQPAGKLPAPVAARNWQEFKVRAAQRIVDANPNGTYLGKPQQVLLAIPVLEVELNANGSIRRIDVMRKPGQAPETLQLAIDAVRRAAPFGDVSRLPRPWKFAEVFLFNDDRRFKPRTLDE